MPISWRCLRPVFDTRKQAGISIEAVRSREGVMHYASKLYIGKEIAAFKGVGKFWGRI